MSGSWDKFVDGVDGILKHPLPIAGNVQNAIAQTLAVSALVLGQGCSQKEWDNINNGFQNTTKQKQEDVVKKAKQNPPKAGGAQTAEEREIMKSDPVIMDQSNCPSDRSGYTQAQLTQIGCNLPPTATNPAEIPECGTDSSYQDLPALQGRAICKPKKAAPTPKPR